MLSTGGKSCVLTTSAPVHLLNIRPRHESTAAVLAAIWHIYSGSGSLASTITTRSTGYAWHLLPRLPTNSLLCSRVSKSQAPPNTRYGCCNSLLWSRVIPELFPSQRNATASAPASSARLSSDYHQRLPRPMSSRDFSRSVTISGKLA